MPYRYEIYIGVIWEMEMMNPKVRVTGILIEDNRILLVEQKVTESLDRQWSLPGGGLEIDETIEACLIREIKEETGLEIQVHDLIYICDRIQDGRHVVHLTFSIEKNGGVLSVGHEPEKDANPIKDVMMVPISQMMEYGFNKKFQALAEQGFPDKGSYKESIENIGL